MAALYHYAGIICTIVVLAIVSIACLGFPRLINSFAIRGPSEVVAYGGTSYDASDLMRAWVNASSGTQAVASCADAIVDWAAWMDGVASCPVTVASRSVRDDDRTRRPGHGAAIPAADTSASPLVQLERHVGGAGPDSTRHLLTGATRLRTAPFP